MNFDYRIYCCVDGKVMCSKLTNNTNIAFAFYKRYIDIAETIHGKNITVKVYYKNRLLKNYKKVLKNT